MKDVSKNSGNIHSQTGEDNALERVFAIIGTTNKWCVEFGAWDGIHNSNTYSLINKQGWSAVLIEADRNRYEQLVKNMASKSNVICFNKFVNFEGEDSMDRILAKTTIPKNFDLLSIDIDGNDYHIWDSINKYIPRVVIIEFNPTIPPEVEFIQEKNMRVTQGSSLLALYNLAKKKGYELVAATELNGIFVRKEEYAKFGVTDNSPTKLMSTERLTKFFQLYDGTVVIQGENRLLWNHLKLTPRRIQLVPKIFRMFPDNMSPLRRLCFRLWKKITSWIY